MDSFYDKKRCAEKSINDLLECLVNLETGDNNVIDELNKKNEIINQMNKKLIKEMEEKDNHINIMQKTIDDHANNIDNLTKEIDELKSVKEEENKFAMLKAKDKEISNLNKEIISLKKELEQANSKISLLESEENNIDCEVVEDEPEPTPVEEEPVEDEPEPTPVEDEPEEDEESSDEDVPKFVTKKIKGVVYAIEKDNPNSKIYEFVDGDVGKVVGEIKGKKKIIY
jgi:chromosome segregation ATPase